MQATAEMRAHCEAQAERVREHMHALQATLVDAGREAFEAAHRDVPPLRRGELPCVIGAPLAKLLGVVCLLSHGPPAVINAPAQHGPSASVHACGSPTAMGC